MHANPKNSSVLPAFFGLQISRVRQVSQARPDNLLLRATALLQ